MRYKTILFLTCLFLSAPLSALTIGSKNFTENVVIAEIVSQYLTSQGIPAVHKKNLGGTRILWDALLTGDIDLYPDYTGTLIYEIFSERNINNIDELREVLSEHGLNISPSLGFNNTYVLGMQRARATTANINSISDLIQYPDLKIGLSNEFMARADGWLALQSRYGLPHENVVGLDHDLAYRGLENRDLDIIDLYSTDAEIEYYDIQPLVDDKNFFPDYFAVIIYRNELSNNYPRTPMLLDRLEGQINEARMIDMNAAVKLDRESEESVASKYLSEVFSIETNNVERSGNNFIKNTRDHLLLVAISLSAAILVSIPLGILASRKRKTGQIILAIAGIFQTIPALALLVFMIPLLGIGGPPAVVALFLYSLLPIIRNTYSGLNDIPAPIQESAIALGLPELSRLRLIEIPMAMRSIISGIKISAVINIGTATLGALIGAGGYGQPIITGIRLNDIGLILQGAVPAAIMALLVQTLFELIERAFIPRGMRKA